MIDIESIVVNTITTDLETALLEKYPNLTVASDYVESPASFPYVFILEDDNYTPTEYQDESLQEHYAHVSFLINIYTNNQATRKSTAKEIANLIDQSMQNMKFTRIMCRQTPNIDDHVFRMSMRYDAVVARGVVDGETTVYQMYRR